MSNQEQIIRSYLLGELPESEQLTLEEKYFSDQQLFEQMVQVENDLVDKYARGLLSPETLDRFEKYYMAHPERRERAKFAETLAAKMDANAGVETVPITASWWDLFSAAMRGPKLAWGLAIALLLFALLAGWFFIETKQLRQELARIESAQLTREERERELQQQIANQQLRAQKLSEEVERLQQGVAAPSPSPELAKFATLILTIGGTRGVDAGPTSTLKISSETEQVRLQLRLRENNYSAYQVVIQSADGKPILTSRQLAAPRVKTHANLSLTIPAQKFTTGDYIITLVGATSTGELEDVSKSLIHVERK
ncbi:MAG TPA: hypothetical protein VGQ39_07995 [Pyrinomonadaceae bacterium]|jgi:hypothetical protein|nr:hypothetical protein [Pyrinomonadaceae bacterium]